MKTKSRGSLPQFRTLIVAALFALIGCKENPKDDCKEEFERKIEHHHIGDDHHVYFDHKDFDFIEDGKSEVQELSFESEVENHKDGKDSREFSINGKKCSRRDGGDDLEKSCKDQGRYCAKLEKFYLNGSQSALDFLNQVRRQKGEMKISVGDDDRHGKVKKAWVIVKGYHHRTCKPPKPDPDPKPVAPNTTISKVTPAEGVTASTTIAFEFTANQNGVRFMCSLDMGAYNACSSPANFSGLVNGAHNFRVYAINSSGLSGNPAQYQWTINSVPPSVTITNLASLKSLTNLSTIHLEFVSSQPGTLTCTLDQGPGAACTSPKDYSGLSDGQHTVKIAATDTQGVTGVPAVFQWTVDSLAPIANIVSVLPAEPINAAHDVVIEMNSNESGTFECSVDGSPFATCQSPFSIVGVSEGPHIFTTRANDLAGNQSLPVSYSWTADFTAPMLTLNQATPAQGLTSAQQISVDFALSEDGDINCRLDNEVAALCSSPFTSAITVAGAHQLIISATDRAGNASNDLVLSWTFDFTIPEISFGEILPSAGQYVNSHALSLVVNSTKVTTLSASLNSISQGVVSSPVQLNNLTDGNYSIEISGVDLAGNSSNTITHAFTVDTTVPILMAQSAVGALTQLDTNTLTFSLNETGVILCNIDSMGYAPCASPLVLSGLADGLHSALIYGQDLAGNTSAVSELSWTIDSTAPAITLTSHQLNYNTIDMTFVADEPNVAFTCHLDNATAQSCQSVLTLADLSAGDHVFYVYGQDLAGNKNPAGASLAFNIRPKLTTIFIGANPTESLTTVNNMTLAFSSSHSDATFLCSLNGAVPSACTSPLTYSGLADGDYSFHVAAVDVFGVVDAVGADYSWSIDTLSPQVFLVVNRINNSAIAFSFTASEANVTWTCSLDGQVIDPCTSPLTFSENSMGDHTFVVNARDVAGNQNPVPTSYTYNVRPPLTTTIVSSAPPTQYTNLRNLSATFTSNYSDATFVCSFGGGALIPCNSPVSYSVVVDGTYVFLVNAIDPYGYKDPIGATHTWIVDTQAPIINTIGAATTSTSLTVTWTTNEPTTSQLYWGINDTTVNIVPEDNVYSTTHSVRVTGLSPNTLYSFKAAGTDRAGNGYIGNRLTARTAR